MTVAEKPPASAVSFDKNRNVNRMTAAEMPPASAVSFDKKRNVNRATVEEMPPAGASLRLIKENKTIQSTGRLWRRYLRPVPGSG